MKEIILVRHAKSDWGNALLPDFERPLNERGKKDAPFMAARLRSRIPVIDAFVSSRKTAAFFAKEYGLDKTAIRLIDELYEPAENNFVHVIKKLEDPLSTVILFSHNNGITDFANSLTNARIDNMPTCGIFAVKVHTDSWQDFMNAEMEFDFFDYPKAEL
jgi:phosphohistidine phosphatase